MFKNFNSFAAPTKSWLHRVGSSRGAGPLAPRRNLQRTLCNAAAPMPYQTPTSWYVWSNRVRGAKLGFRRHFLDWKAQNTVFRLNAGPAPLLTWHARAPEQITASSPRPLLHNDGSAFN